MSFVQEHLVGRVDFRRFYEAEGVVFRGKRGLCPFHDDHTPDFDVVTGTGLFFCQACHEGGDPVTFLVKRHGMTEAEAIAELKRRYGVGSSNGGTPPDRDEGNGSMPVIVDTYDYEDASGKLLFQVVRYVPKDFKQRRPDGNDGWIWNLRGVQSVLYHLPELLAASKDRTVFASEGEKDVHSLERAGFLATTSPGGAGKWRAEHSETLRGRNVVLLPHNDESGRSHVEGAGQSLHGIAASVKLLELAGLPPKGDVTDWLAKGGTAAELERLAATAPEWNPAAVEISYGEAVTVCLSDVQAEKVEWLWPSRIPLGKLTMIDGDPGLGKSTMTLDIAARVTRGQPLPDGAGCAPGNVILLSAEDSLKDTIRPRLDAAGADVHRVTAITGIRSKEGPDFFPSIEEHIPQIERAIRSTGARLVIWDPLMAFLGDGIDSYRDQDVRRALAPLAAVADENGAATVLVRHLTKGGGSHPTYRGGGSIGIIAAARSGLLVGKDPDDEERRILASVKSNLCAAPASLAFRLEDAGGVARVCWEAGQADITAEQLLTTGNGDEEERSAAGEARGWLGYFLADGPHESGEVCQQARKRGIADRTLRRAAKSLGVEKHKSGFREGWFWRLPSAEGGQDLPKVATSTGWPSSATVGHLREEKPPEASPEPAEEDTEIL